MKAIRADKSHKEHVLRLLDEFRTECAATVSPAKKLVSTTAREAGGDLFDNTITSSNSAIFLVVHGNKYVGIVTIYKIPQIRKGVYCGEIEEMFVEPDYQGIGVAQLLINSAVDWAKEEKIKTIRLESSNELKRAHSFYKKAGFTQYGHAYQKTI